MSIPTFSFPRVPKRAVGGAVILGLLVMGGHLARAALSWERREVDLGLQDVSKEPGTLEARFPFTNVG